MLNQNNQIIARAIASAYCNTNETCKNSVYNRLTSYFDDANFFNFLATLPNRAYLIGSFVNEGETAGGLVKINFKYFDIVKGDAGEVRKIIPMLLFTQKNFQAILSLFLPGLIWVKQNSDNSTMFINPNYGYNIAYTTDPINGGGSENGGGVYGGANSGDEGGGKIIVPSNDLNNTSQVYQVPAASSGFDLTSLLIPGAILAGLYFLTMKK